ncbi:NAD(P)H dehydrogenase (quinone) [Christiangramia gaetbulicola]|uniref:NAD(P)H dehydrogenase (Quinone) n=1 Tax=Christiangramia gaetbulicola TaxID=703340 RepID=A0A2T6AFR4_9FLAO|nr:NAD(P)H:quinone oxidoreductase [Christiangramia gaetbulicola]PTX42663.1 NAD(P)H dehydrogenase (quinone) [Christiangramia gaetbulicola]
MNIAIIYYSATGTNHQMAKWAAEAAKSEGTHEVRLRRIRETAPKEAIESNDAWKKHHQATQDIETAELDDLDWADAIIFSIPTRYGNLPSQVQAFFDTTGGLWSQGKLVNKVVSGMTSAQNPHGGQETTLLSLYKSMYHWGAIVAAPGYTSEELFKTGGNPYGFSTNGGVDNLDEKSKTSITHQVKRAIKIAECIKKGMS